MLMVEDSTGDVDDEIGDANDGCPSHLHNHWRETRLDIWRANQYEEGGDKHQAGEDQEGYPQRSSGRAVGGEVGAKSTERIECGVSGAGVVRLN